jgi:hypothetical protein
MNAPEVAQAIAEVEKAAGEMDREGRSLNAGGVFFLLWKELARFKIFRPAEG